MNRDSRARPVRVLVVLRKDQHDAIKSAAKEAGKSRCGVVRDALDRYLNPVPDAELPAAGIYNPK